jgi:hypothetical protein
MAPGLIISNYSHNVFKSSYLLLLSSFPQNSDNISVYLVSVGWETGFDFLETINVSVSLNRRFQTGSGDHSIFPPSTGK